MKSPEEIWYEGLYDISNITSPVEVITAYQIDTLVDKKWDFFKVHPINGNTVQDVIKSNPRLNVKSWSDTGSNKSDKWIIFNPDDNDLDTKDAYREIHSYLKELSKLSQLQIQLHKADIYTDVTELRQKIEDLFYKLFPKQIQDNQRKEESKKINSKQPAAGLTLKDVFKTYTDYDKIIKLLKGDNYLDKQSEIVVWLDRSKGCISKGHGLLEHLCKMGYITGDKLSPAQKLSILKNTFIINAKIDSVNRYPKQKFIKEFEFIPAKK